MEIRSYVQFRSAATPFRTTPRSRAQSSDCFIAWVLWFCVGLSIVLLIAWLLKYAIDEMNRDDSMQEFTNFARTSEELFILSRDR